MNSVHVLGTAAVHVLKTERAVRTMLSATRTEHHKTGAYRQDAAFELL